MQHFIWVFTVCRSTYIGVTSECRTFWPRTFLPGTKGGCFGHNHKSGPMVGYLCVEEACACICDVLLILGWVVYIFTNNRRIEIQIFRWVGSRLVAAPGTTGSHSTSSRVIRYSWCSHSLWSDQSDQVIKVIMCIYFIPCQKCPWPKCLWWKCPWRKCPC